MRDSLILIKIYRKRGRKRCSEWIINEHRRQDTDATVKKNQKRDGEGEKKIHFNDIKIYISIYLEKGMDHH